MIQPPVVLAQNSKIGFAVTPSVVPLATVTCSLSGGPNGTVNSGPLDCLGLSVKEFMNLAYGEYKFTVTAVDQQNLSSSASVIFLIVAPPCTPLVNYNAECDIRLKATLYFHPDVYGRLPSEFRSVLDYIKPEYKVEKPLFFTDLWIPTRSFTSGFPTISDRTEYFALDIRSKLQPSTTMQVGQYQLGILSDDGSIISQIDNNGLETDLVRQDSYTSTKFGCASSPITLTSTEKIKLHVRYFQGPRDAIALVLLYRPWSQSNVNAPIACGTTDRNFFGPFPAPVKDPNDRTYPANTKYSELLTQGWMPIPAASFANPDLP